MTTEEMIAVMQARVDGKKIECSLRGGYYWYECTSTDWDWIHYEYRVKPEPVEPQYRPYKDCEEMIEDYKERFDMPCPSYTMPKIWIQGTGDLKVKRLIYSYGDQCISVVGGLVSLNSAFDNYTYLDGTPVGKLVEE